MQRGSAVSRILYSAIIPLGNMSPYFSSDRSPDEVSEKRFNQESCFG